MSQVRIDSGIRCSFCQRAGEEAGRLISNPDNSAKVFICGECVAICTQALANRPDPFSGNPLLEEFLSAAERWATRESSGHQATEELSKMRRVASMLFRTTDKH
jgi:predicted metal-binding protein